MSNPIPHQEQPSIRIAVSAPQESRGSLLVPGLLALLVIAAAALILVHYTYHKDPSTGSISSTMVYPIHTAPRHFGGLQIASDKGSDQVYLLPVVAVDNHITLPIFIESIAADVITADGTTLHCLAAQQSDFKAMYDIYPDLGRSQAAQVNPPLLRDTRIEPKGEAHGLVMVHFPLSKDDWTHRHSATVTVSFYHQAPLTIPFPQNQ
jgi:hypothetical protein